MANRDLPDAFANALTGVYATDPGYGTNLIALMGLYNLYRYDSAAPATTSPTATSPTTVPRTASPPAAPAKSRVAGRQAAVPGVAGTSGTQEGPGHTGGPAAPVGIPGVAAALTVGVARTRAARSRPALAAEPRRGSAAAGAADRAARSAAPARAVTSRRSRTR